MGTRSIIAMRKPNGLITAVYCHWDGYIEHNGRILYEHYSDTKKLALLLKHGDLSILGPEIGEKHDFDARAHGQCTFYSRDRGDLLQVSTFESLDKLIAFASGCGTEYVYLYDQHNCVPHWLFTSRGTQFFGLDDGRVFSPWRDLADIVRHDHAMLLTQFAAADVDRALQAAGLSCTLSTVSDHSTNAS